MTEKVKKPKHRSPNFPAINLQKAVELTGKLLDEFGKHEIPVNLVNKAWGYQEEGSSSGNRCVAAVKAFGLIDVTGFGKNRKVKVSDYGYRIHENAPDRAKILKIVVLLPEIHSTVWEHFNGSLPNNDLLKNYLLWEHEPKFNKQSVSTFISEFRDSISFAKLESSSYNEVEDEDSGDDEDESPEIKVGDLVNWESQGMLQFPEPKEVTGFSECKEWVFVKGSETGLPINDIKLIRKAQAQKMDAQIPHVTPAIPPKNPLFQSSGPSLSMDIFGDNHIEIKLKKKVTIKEWEKIKQLFDFSENTFLEMEKEDMN